MAIRGCGTASDQSAPPFFFVKELVMSKNYAIVDQRTNPKGKSHPNRQRFMGRQQEVVKDAVRRKITESGIDDIATKSPKRIKLRSVRTDEPTFHHQPGGVSEDVFPGNKKFSKGDKLPRPEKDEVGSAGSQDGEGEDDFEFDVSREEFLNIIFDGMEIPNIVKKTLKGEVQFEWHRAGLSSDGPPNKMDVVRTMGKAFGRRVAMRRVFENKKVEAERRLKALEEAIANAGDGDTSHDQQKAEAVRREIKTYEERIKNIPDIDTNDLLFKRHERTPVPVSQAVMFCILDVSGSMGAWEKEMSKRFFLLLYLFLRQSYERVEIVFIRHTQDAKEVDEEEFFYSRETGGTVVSSALFLMKSIIEARYPIDSWNIYGCHASDGDNFMGDNVQTYLLMEEVLLPLTQYYAYIEVRREGRSVGELWPVMEEVAKGNEHFAMMRIRDARDIYPVFRKLFEKK